MRSRQAAIAADSSPSSSWPSEVLCRGVWTITSWNPVADDALKRSGSRPREEARRGSPAAVSPSSGLGTARGLVPLALCQRRVEVGNGTDPPSRRVRRVPRRADRPRSRAGCDPRGPRRRGSSGGSPLVDGVGAGSRSKSKGRSARAGERIVRSPVSWSSRISGCRLLVGHLERLRHPDVLDPGVQEGLALRRRIRWRRRRPRPARWALSTIVEAPFSRASASARRDQARARRPAGGTAA